MPVSLVNEDKILHNMLGVYPETGGAKQKRTFQPKKIHRAKKHGFLSRSKSVNGRKVLAARRRKGRAKLAA